MFPLILGIIPFQFHRKVYSRSRRFSRRGPLFVSQRGNGILCRRANDLIADRQPDDSRDRQSAYEQRFGSDIDLEGEVFEPQVYGGILLQFG